MNFIKRAKISYIIISAIMVAIGLFLIIFPDISALIVCYIIGAVVTVFGVIKLIGYFSKDIFRLAFQFDFALGIFSVIAGILMILHPANILKTIPVIIGVFTVVDGTFKLQTARDAHRFGMKGWWSILVLAVLTCAGGLFLIINPFDGASALMILTGVTFMVDGIQNLAVVAYTVKAVRADDEKPDTIYIEYEDKSNK